MAIELERMIATLEANFNKYDRALAKAVGNTDRSFSRIERRGKKLEASLSSIGGNFGKGLLAGAAGVFSVQSAQQFLDAATRINNALKVAGLNGNQLTKVYDRLFAISQKNATSLEGMVGLYSRLSLVQKELGISQDELLTFTDRIGLALRVSGKSATEASGALLQLSQALGGGIVRAEEFNSILEGAPAIAQAAAAGLKEAGGSVSKLRTLVVDGKVSSEAFFRAFLAGSETLEKKLAGSKLTISQAFQQIQNALIDTAKKFDKSTGSSEKLATALGNVAKAIGDLGNAATQATNGPLADFYNLLGDLIDRAVQLGADFGAATGLDQIGGNPYIGQRRIQERIDGAFDGGSYSTPKGDRLGTQSNPAQVEIVDPDKQVSVEQYPANGDGLAGQVDRATNSFGDLNEAVNRFVDNVVQAESGGDRNAKNPNSSATGVGQFIESTWLDLFKRHFPDRAKSMSDQTILALRSDAEISRALIEQYARENASLLRQAGVSVNEAALQLAHFLGPQGAISVLQAAPNTPVSNLLSPDAIKANPTILGYGATAADVIAYAERRTKALQGEKRAVDELSDSWDGLRETTADKTAVEAQKQAYQELGQIGQSALQGLANALSDGKLEGEELLQILFQVAQQLLSMPNLGGLLGGLGGGGGLLGGLIIPGILHGGGVAGKDGYGHGRAVSPSVFTGARRMHRGGVAGLRPDEVPTILQKGERVTPRGGGGQGGMHITVGVSADNNGNLLPFVESVTENGIRKAAPKIADAGAQQGVKIVRKNFGSMFAEAQTRTF